MDKVLIKDIAEVVNGSTPSTKENSYWDGNIPWITPKDLSAFSGRYISSGERNITKEGYLSCSTTLVPKNTILLTSRAPIGYLAIAKNDLCTNQGFKSLICNQSKVLPLYLFYWLSTKIEFLKSISGGATFKELSKTSLENVVMDLPNIVQQQHIVDTIGTIDDLIENSLNIKENLSKLSHLSLEKSAKFRSKKVRLCTIASVSSGKAKNKIVNGKYPLIGANGQIGLSNETNACEYSIVTGRVGTLGKFQYFDSKIWCSDNTLIIDSKFPTITFLFLKNHFDFKTIKRGSTQPLLTQKDLGQIEILIPTDSEATESKLTMYQKYIWNIEKQIEVLKSLKNMLLAKYF